ncbi:dihydrofolate reductase family protein [Microbacterium rhizomatis]|uniref:Dihydrofolate reductase n=1 Tax=Microbacterium rhizomatis TaxID=1631477 RepID=A0A5J5J3I8_9MICO|nr:dihydrofolate reductase family protein [Microbacterium rhizomatis]KAA9110601.1 dihydrofolate reductase [Microbacterium rhizomatis]
MPRTIFYTATTLNGFLADDSDSLDWLFRVPGGESAETGDTGFADFLANVGVIVEGSTTYEWVVAHERLTEHPEKWQEFYGARPTFVFTTRDLPRVAGADVRFVRGSVDEHWDEIAAAAGHRDVWLVGGGDLVGQFADAGRLDELRVSVAPVTLVSGRPLLPRRIESNRLRLESVDRTGQFARLVYSVAPPA